MMENSSGFLKSEDEMELPAGFRFHPTDEELITHYLSRKVVDSGFCAIAIGEVDMNKVEPWELPWRAKLGEKEWYFFCVRDKKYPTGLRTNRATAAGYWKATGKDKEIFRGKALVGMKKTLVFYKGRAPKGEKSNWVCHEYRLEGKFAVESLPKASKNDWVISRVFHKDSGGKKIPIGGLMRMNSEGNELPPLVDISPAKPEFESGEPGHVHCFSNTVVSAPHGRIQDDVIKHPIIFPASSNPLDSFAPSTPVLWGQFPQVHPGIGLPFPGSVPPLQDPSIIRSFIMNQGFRREREVISVSHDSSVVSNLEMGKKMLDEQEGTLETGDLECIWNY